MTMIVTSAVVDALLAETRESHPRECCGLLFGDDHSITAHRSANNVHPHATTRFEIDPQVLIDAHRAMRAGGPRLVGYYHSHPQGLPKPSATDRAQAADDGMIWAIVGKGQLALWRAGDDAMRPLPYRVADA